MFPHSGTAAATIRRSRQRSEGEASADIGLLFSYYLAGAAATALQFGERYDAEALGELQPILIAAPPRCGTTLLFRLLCLDSSLTSPTLLETLAPSHRTTKWASKPSPVLRTVAKSFDASLKRFDGLHRSRLLEPEEDVFCWHRRLTGPALALTAPYLHELRHRWFIDDLPSDEQEMMLNSYRRAAAAWCGLDGVKRSDHPAELLLKNTHAGGTINQYLRIWPELRVIDIRRDPARSVPSAVQLIKRPIEIDRGRKFDGRRPEWRALAEIAVEYRRRLDQVRPSFADGRWLELPFEELTTDPMATVENIYRFFNLELSSQTRAAMAAMAADADAFRTTEEPLTLADIGLGPTDLT